MSRASKIEKLKAEKITLTIELLRGQAWKAKGVYEDAFKMHMIKRDVPAGDVISEIFRQIAEQVIP